MVMRIILARIMSHPLAAIMHVRRFRMAFHVCRGTANWRRVCRWLRMRCRTAGRNKPPTHMRLPAPLLTTPLLTAALGHQQRAAYSQKNDC